MSDPLIDPRARDLIAADPDEVAALASGLAQAASDSAVTAGGLSAAQRDATWTGVAADAFRGRVAPVPARLGRIEMRLCAVSQALAAYEDGLAPMRAAFIGTMAALADAEARAAQARTAAEAMAWADEAERLHARAAQLLDEFDALRIACRGRIASVEATPS